MFVLAVELCFPVRPLDLGMLSCVPGGAYRLYNTRNAIGKSLETEFLKQGIEYVFFSFPTALHSA